MISTITVIGSMIFSLRKRHYWLLGLSAIYYLLAIFYVLTIRPIVGLTREIPYIALVLFIVYLAFTLVVACRNGTNGKIAKTPLVLVGIASVLRITSFVCSRYLHSHAPEWYFHHYDKIETYTKVIHALTTLIVCVCYCILIYFVFFTKRKRDKQSNGTAVSPTKIFKLK